MKKIKPYFVFSSISLVLAIILSYIFDFSLQNTWQAGIAIALVFGPYWIFGWKLTNEHKKVHGVICGIAKFYLILLLLGYLFTVGLFIFNPEFFPQP